MDLSLAVKNGDYVRLKNLLKNSANVNFIDENGMSLLHQAVNYGCEKIVKLLLKNGAEVLKVTGNKGNTALHIAVMKNNVSIVVALLENIPGEKLHKLLNAKTKKTGSTALHVAAKTHCYEIAKILLINGAIFNVKDKEAKQPVDFVKGDERLEALLKLIEMNFSLVEFGNPELCFRLIEQPLDEYLCMNNCRDDKGRTILQIALKGYHLDTMQILFVMRYKRSSYFPYTDMAALNELASNFETHVDTSNEFLNKLMDVRFNPSIAIQQLNILISEVRKVLQSFRTYEQTISKSIRILNIQSIEETLEFFERHADYRNADFIRSSILPIIMSVDIVNRQIFTSKLILASKSNDLVQVERCLANKVDVDAEDEINGRTPLHLAAFYGYVNLARILLDWHASLTSVDASGNMPLHIAASNGHLKIVEMLLERNVEMINVKGTSGEFTALHLATGAGYLEIVKCLMKHGANYLLPSRSGKMPIDMAREVRLIRFFELVNRLFQMAADGNEKIINELKTLKKDELMAVMNARDGMQYNLLQKAIVWKHKSIADNIARVVKDKLDKK